MNISLMLADAAVHLARMEAKELQNQYHTEIQQVLEAEEGKNQLVKIN